MATFQVNARGAQDQFLTANPQISFWTKSVTRYTPFAIKEIQQTFLGTPSTAGRSTVEITRSGDLFNDVYVEIISTGNTAVAYYDLIKDVWCEIGGTQISRLYGDWMATWRELTTRGSQTNGESAMSGTGGTQYYKLPFWFTQHPALSLPIAALSFHKVMLIFEWGSIPASSTVNCWASYVFLGEAEREWFANNRHMYLISQVQREVFSTPATSTKFRMNFNHPVKELIWEVTSDTGVTDGSFRDTTAITDTTTARILLNGNERVPQQRMGFYQLLQPSKYHTRTPVVAITGAVLPALGNADAATDKRLGAYVYSFSLVPEDPFNPSGSLNFSRVDNAEIEFSAAPAAAETNARLVMFAPNWNVAQVTGNMFFLLYNS